MDDGTKPNKVSYVRRAVSKFRDTSRHHFPVGVCPRCKAVDSYDVARRICTVCGVPDEALTSRSQLKKFNKRINATGGSKNRKHRKHGRVKPSPGIGTRTTAAYRGRSLVQRGAPGRSDEASPSLPTPPDAA